MRYAGVRIFYPFYLVALHKEVLDDTAVGTFDLLVVRGGRCGRGKTKYSAATACVGPASSVGA